MKFLPSHSEIFC